jgi:hypothetical protein
MGTGYVRNDTSNNIANGKVASASDIDGEFDAIVAAFNESTGHTHDGTSAEGAPITVIGPAQDFVAGASDLKPKTDSAYTLGTSGNRWSNVYSDSMDVAGDITVTGVLGSAGLYFIESQDLSGDATADFTGFDASKFDSYLFTFINVSPATDGQRFEMRTSSNGGSSYDITGYAYSVSAGAAVSSGAGTAIRITQDGVGSAANEAFNGNLHLYGPNQSQYTRVTHTGCFTTGTGTFVHGYGAGERQSAGVVDAVRFLFASGNIASGTINMYGVKA